MRFLLLFCLLFMGCRGVLRYNFENAINNLPPNSRVIYVNNDYVEYSNNKIIYRAFYRTNGEIYKTEKTL